MFRFLTTAVAVAQIFQEDISPIKPTKVPLTKNITDHQPDEVPNPIQNETEPQKEMIQHDYHLDLLKNDLKPTPVYNVNLDLPPEERWNEILLLPQHKDFVDDMLKYFDTIVHNWVGTVSWIAKHLVGTFPNSEYVRELQGIAATLSKAHPHVKNPLGIVVTGNLVYQFEALGVTCQKMNTTGPCPPRDIFDHGPSFCSSIIGIDHENQQTMLGRNMDWNFPAVLVKYIMRLNFQRNGKTLYSGSGFLGFVGVLHGMNEHFAVSMNARKEGGQILENIWNLIFRHRITPSQLMRQQLQKSADENIDFAGSVEVFSNTGVANPVYFTVADGKAPNGVIIARGPGDVSDKWYLSDANRPASKQTTWYHVQTNYDTNEVEPSFDARRKPAVEHLNNLGQTKLNPESFFNEIMQDYPTFNAHTDMSGLMIPAQNYYADFTAHGDVNADEVLEDHSTPEDREEVSKFLEVQELLLEKEEEKAPTEILLLEEQLFIS